MYIVTDTQIYSEITEEDLQSITIMPVVIKGDTAQLLEKKYVTRPRQVKPEDVTTQSSMVDSLSNEVALPPTSSSTKNDGYMMPISNMRRDGTEEMTILTEALPVAGR